MATKDTKPTGTEAGKLGLRSCIGILVGGMVGSAVFSLSGVTIAQAGPAVMIAWIIGGLILLGYGMITAELSARYPQSGGVYVFPAKAFRGAKGRFWGWISCWSSLLTNIVAVAFSAIYVGTYLSVAFPFAAKLQIPLALASIGLCLLLNCISFTRTGKINTAVVAALLCTMALYIGFGLFGGAYEPKNLLPFFTQGSGGATGFLAAVPTAIIAYSAVTAIAYMVSEVKEPARNVPKAVIISIVLVIFIYVLMLFTTVGLVTAGYLTENPGMQYIPLFAACFTALAAYPWLTGVVSIAAVLALLTTMLVCTSMNARLVQAVAKDGLLPSFLGRTNRKGAPAMATLVTVVPCAVISVFPALTETLVNFGALFNCISLVITILSLIAARKNEPDLVPGFRAPCGLVLPLLELGVLLVCNLSGIFTGNAVIWLYTVGFLLVALSIWLLRRKHIR